MNDIFYYIISTLRVVIAFLTTIFLPGKAFISLIFSKHTISKTENNLLSIASGTTMLSLLGSLSLWIFGKISLLWLYIVLMILVIIFFAGMLLRNNKANENIDQQMKLSFPRIFIWCLILILGLLFIQIPGLNQYSLSAAFVGADRTTEFYISPSYLNSINDIYPEDGGFYQIPVEIVNNDLSEQAYYIGVTHNDIIIGDIVTISVSPGDKVKVVLTIASSQISPDSHIDINLFNQDSDSRTSRLRLWLGSE